MLHWKDSEKPVYLFYLGSYNYYSGSGNKGEVFQSPRWSYDFGDDGTIYPKQDLTPVANYKVTTINPGDKLFFDPGSSFPRFKLSIPGNKRCIKIPKADVIVVSGNNNFKIPQTEYLVLEDETGIYLVPKDDLKDFKNDLNHFLCKVSPYKQFENVNLIYTGRLTGYGKDSLYLAKYVNGDYAVPFITDNDLDKFICNMCPDPTYDEIINVIDMLNSDDAAIVQLATKTLTGFNIEKYRLTFRLILCTRKNWYDFTRNTVGTKQLVETLNIDKYRICDTFINGAYYVQEDNVSYDIDDIAMAKRISLKLVQEWLQKTYKDYILSRNYEWAPDKRRVELQ